MMSVTGPGEPLEPNAPVASPEGEAGFGVESGIDNKRGQEAIDEDDPVLVERAVEEPKPLPLHIQNSLTALLGAKAEDYAKAADEEKIAILLGAIGGSPDMPAKSGEPVIDQRAIKASLDLITQRSQLELARQLSIFSVERSTDLFDKLNAVSTTARRLGANRLRGFLGVGAGVAAGVLTSTAIRMSEKAAGYAGGGVGAILGAFSYQAIYQRATENSWQRVSNPAGAYVKAVLRSPFQISESAQQKAELVHAAEPRTLIGRAWRSARVGFTAYRVSLGERLHEISNQSKLQAAEIDGLDEQDLLWRVADARLALTRQERRVRSVEPVSESHERQLELYGQLVKKAVTVFTPGEIKAAMDEARFNARLNFVGSLAFGAAGGLLGYFGARALHGQLHEASKPGLAPPPTESPSVTPAHEPVPQPTTSHILPEPDLQQLGHLGRAKALESVGAGHFENGRFIITAEQGVDAQGQYIMAAGHRLSVSDGVTDISPLKVEMREYVDFRSAEIQRAVTGKNLVEAYQADQSTLARATEIKDALAKHLVEQQVYGQSNLDANIQQQLASVGYDFDYSDVRSTNDVRAEIHQAMSKWFSAQPKPTPITDWKPTLPRPIEVVRPSLVPAESIHSTPAPSIERYLYDAPEAVVSEPTAASPELATAPRLDLSINDQPQLHEYKGWHWPTVEDDMTAQTAEPTVKVQVIEEPKISAPKVVPAEPRLAQPELMTVSPSVVGPSAPQHPSFEVRVDKNAVLDDFFPDGGPQISPAEIEEAIRVDRGTLTD